MVIIVIKVILCVTLPIAYISAMWCLPTSEFWIHYFIWNNNQISKCLSNTLVLLNQIIARWWLLSYYTWLHISAKRGDLGEKRDREVTGRTERRRGYSKNLL